MTACPADDSIAAFAAAQLATTTRTAIQEHLESCTSCHALFGELARMNALTPWNETADGAERASTEPAEMRPGAGFDGYVLQRRIDVGAMGEVWLAEDLSLQRPIAVKVLRGHAEVRDPRWAGVLRREAQSLAQLSHPNVVVVHDVSAWHGRDYLAMEYVAGATLGEWLASGRPTLAERLDAMVQSGRGLAAAHRAGVIHRDFKPSNVMMGEDGRARVSDFGLARLRSSAAGGGGPASADAAHTSVAGTPVYMAPEQLRGAAPSEAGDQYSFAVSLHEAIYGARPYAGGSVTELLAAIERGAPRAPATQWRVPGWLRATVMRGLSADPDRRFSSMDAVVAAIETGRQRQRRGRLAMGLIAVAAVTAAISTALSRGVGPAAGPACGGDAEAVAAVWNPARAATVARQFEQIGGSAGAEHWRRTAPLFDDYATRWAAMRRETCEATRVRREQSDSLFDRRMYCLDRRLAQLDSVAAALATVDSKKVVLSGIDVASGLPNLDACQASSWLADAPMPPLDQRTAIDAAYRLFDAARTQSVQGRHQAALAALQALAPQAQALGFAPLEADVAYELAYVADWLGEFDVAGRAYERASRLAAELGRRNVVFEAQLRLMRMEAFQGKYDLALAKTSSLASLARLSTDPAHLAMHHENLGAIYNLQGRYEPARAEFEQAVALLPDGAPVGRITSAREGLGLVLIHLREYDAAAAELARTLELREQRYGPVHPRVANTLNNLGNLTYDRGDVKAALAHWQRALAIQESFAGTSGDPDIALTVGNIAIAQQDLGQLDAALASFDRALELRTRFFGAEHAEVSRALANKATLLAKLGRYAEGESAARRAQELRIKTLPAGHPDLARGALQLGDVLVRMALAQRGRRVPATYRAALATLDRAVDGATQALGPKDYLVASALYRRARGQLGLGNLGAARADAEHARDIMVPDHGAASDEVLVVLTVLAEVMLAQDDAAAAVATLTPAVPPARVEGLDGGYAAFVLARGYDRLGRRREAIDLATRAIAALGASAQAEAAVRATAARAWLRARPTR